MVSHPIAFPTLLESCPGYYEARPALESQEVRAGKGLKRSGRLSSLDI